MALTTQRKSGSAAGAAVRGIWSLRGEYRILHLTWFAFFLSFVVWFNFAPFAKTIGAQFGLTKAQLTTLALCNVALTVPARLLIGMLLDRLGPRRVYGAILMYSAVPCILFATATSFSMLIISRLLASIVGAGFVVGIRMIAEWFPPKKVGMAEGVYGGWGNFGAAAAALTLPALAALAGGSDGWRWATAATGVVAAAYGAVYLRSASDTPEGRSYMRSRSKGALEVTSRPAVWGLVALLVPMSLVLVLIAWRVRLAGVISPGVMWGVIAGVAVLLALQVRLVFKANGPALRNEYPAEDGYPFRSVALLCIAYFCTFGSELAVVSMLPAFFSDTWGLSPALAGATAGAYAFMNLFARPAGGLMSDLLGSRRRTLRVLLCGLGVGYLGMSLMGPGWPVPLAMAVAMACSLFVQSGAGAVFAIVPLVKKRVGGQIAGLVGAYGNVGAILFITALLFVPPRIFFMIIAGSSVVAVALTRWLPEPEASFAEELLTDTGQTQEAAPMVPAVPEPAPA